VLRLVRLSLLALLALAPALIACGEDDEGGTTTAAAPPPAPATSPPATSTAPTSTAGAPDQARLEEALLTEGDLPGDWVAASPSASEPLCGLPPLQEGASRSTSAAFVSDAPPAILSHEVHAYPAGMAEQVMRDVAGAFSDCEEDVGGAAIRLSAAAPPALGDEALAFTGEAVQQGAPRLRVELVLIRRSSLVALVAWSGEQAPERSVLDPILAEADRRLFTLGGA